MTARIPGEDPASLSIPDIREYDRINAELIQCLEDGARHVRLLGAEGQRFLAAGLAGPWDAVIEVEGRAGPEIAAGLDAPRITVVCRGPVADGAGRGLRSGRLVVLGNSGESVAYGQVGGTVFIAGDAGHRAGLNQYGGVLLIRGAVGRLAGERQNGGWLFASDNRVGPHAGRGQRGGRFVRLPSQDPAASSLDPSALETYRKTLADLAPWIDPDVDVPKTSG